MFISDKVVSNEGISWHLDFFNDTSAHVTTINIFSLQINDNLICSWKVYLKQVSRIFQLEYFLIPQYNELQVEILYLLKNFWSGILLFWLLILNGFSMLVQLFPGQCFISFDVFQYSTDLSAIPRACNASRSVGSPPLQTFTFSK